LAALVPCSSGAGCPLGVDVPALASAVLAGEEARARAVARAANPFASSCGHGCHAPCETACRRRHRGAPVAIGALERYASSTAVPALVAADGPCSSAHDARSVTGLVGATLEQSAQRHRSGKRVAIVGAGAAGMACAHDLALLGHHCVVFDADHEPGGLLTRGIPHFRFPVASVRAECASIVSRGVEFRGGSPIRGHESLRALLAGGFDALFLAIGASAPRAPLFDIQGDSAGAVDAMSFLRSTTALAGRVTVIGDGDVAIDAARAAAYRGRQELGEQAIDVQLVLTTPVERSSVSPAMLGAAIGDGITVHDGWSPMRVCAEDGRLVGVEIGRDGGRTSSILQCDHLITAAPRVPPLAELGAELPLDGAGHVAVDPETMRTALPGIWAGGACAFGHRSIAHAIADGKRAAWHIHAAIAGVPVSTALLSTWVEADDRLPGHMERVLATARKVLPHRDGAPVDPFSSSAVPPLEVMQREAARCYDCAVAPSVGDWCTLCGVCVAECPERAFSIVGEPRQLELDQDRCTRCGICADRCPEGAITMVRAVWEERLTTARPALDIAADEHDEQDGHVDEEPVLTPR
jgi:NADPH-dependent glutamate synthase beta subunit-like oxidoreductase/ferredoxin